MINILKFLVFYCSMVNIEIFYFFFVLWVKVKFGGLLGFGIYEVGVGNWVVKFFDWCINFYFFCRCFKFWFLVIERLKFYDLRLLLVILFGEYFWRESRVMIFGIVKCIWFNFLVVSIVLYFWFLRMKWLVF